MRWRKNGRKPIFYTKLLIKCFREFPWKIGFRFFSTFWSLNHITGRSSRPTRTLRMIFSNIYTPPLKTFLLTFLDQSMSWTELGCGRVGPNWEQLVKTSEQEGSLLLLNYLLHTCRFPWMSPSFTLAGNKPRTQPNPSMLHVLKFVQ